MRELVLYVVKQIANFASAGFFMVYESVFGVAKLFYPMRNLKAHRLKLFRSSDFGEKSLNNSKTRKFAVIVSQNATKLKRKAYRHPS